MYADFAGWGVRVAPRVRDDPPATTRSSLPPIKLIRAAVASRGRAFSLVRAMLYARIESFL